MRKNKVIKILCLLAALLGIPALVMVIKIWKAASDPRGAFPAMPAFARSADDAARPAAAKSVLNEHTAVLPALSPTEIMMEALPTFGENDRVSLVLLGIDSNKKRERHGKGYRSDTIVVLSVDLQSGSCFGLSVPRDTRVTFTVLGKDGSVKGTRTDRINAAFAANRGMSKTACENALRALKGFFQSAGRKVDLKYYIAVDMDAIAPITEAVGGLEITLDMDVPGVGKKGEKLTLKGDKALLYLRKRHGMPGGDISRTYRQQHFLTQIAMQIKRMDAVQTVPPLLKALSGNISTNLSLPQMLVIAKALNGADEKNIRFETVPGHCQTIGGKSYYIANKQGTRSILDKMYP